MDKIIADNSVNLCDRLANIVANTVTSECIKILGEIPNINKSDLILKMKSYCEKELVDCSKKDFTSEYSLLESLNKIFN